ncbi:pyrroloquinoline quinone-dependent dehydrogenase [Flavobacterium zepuense]|uniref:Pyrroloquinoline quinone-dependent dehydrogenase n=1 Tax=Flavobacterium zepuense TaxID=2593302 RepID=A0A552UZP2_9FLAO|nr:pyrroloquinoline quinone-dependent dehydrogenase [Flavobacterium zepuense]TRW23679.1 pyrroloquinoline quinone-dependent dehydrogenase [Flavobacterium zepuense]
MKNLKTYQGNIGLLLLLAIVVCQSSYAQSDDARSWSVYKGDKGSTNYSPLSQITPKNVSQLQPAWTLTLLDKKPGAQPGKSECNPIIVDGIMYASSANQNAYAVNAATGKQLWSFDPLDGKNGTEVNRGLTYWENGNDKRILMSANNHLIALDAKTGKLILGFGSGGKVDLKVGLRDHNLKEFYVSLTSPGGIYKDLIILGCRVPDTYGSQPGFIRAYDCRTGKLVWTFHTIPYPGEPGYETWPKDAYKTVGGVNDWAGLSVDSKSGMVFLALGSSSYDFWGAERKGDNLYANCVVALDASTGKHIWHFQTVHHDLWDYDLPAPPALITITKDGKKTDAVAQITKQGFVFVFNRETGVPLFPVEERKVPASTMPGELASPTQPFPVKPKPFARQLITEADLSNYSKKDHDALVKQFRSMRYEGLFTPPDMKGTIEIPGTRGGAEWGGAAFDPVTNLFYIKSTEAPDLITMEKGSDTESIPVVQENADNQFAVNRRGAKANQFINATGYKTWKDPSGNPAITPPWGTLSAIDMATGDYAWQLPLGNDESRQQQGAPETGQESKGGPIVTAGGIIFISGTDDKKLRALDKTTGKLLWETTLPALANATASTYMAQGKQYVVISVAGAKEQPSGSIMAFSLPN